MLPESLRIIREEHQSLAAMLRSLVLLVDRGPDADTTRYFQVLRAMLFYVDEFPERQHHPKESDLLFPMVVRADPACLEAVRRLEQDHIKGEARVRELQHLLAAWEFLGDARRAAFEGAIRPYVAFYLEHMRLEETQILPSAERHLTPADWAQLDAAFAANRDPLMAAHRSDPLYERLFSYILTHAPAPIGVG